MMRVWSKKVIIGQLNFGKFVVCSCVCTVSRCGGLGAGKMHLILGSRNSHAG